MPNEQHEAVVAGPHAPAVEQQGAPQAEYPTVQNADSELAGPQHAIWPEDLIQSLRDFSLCAFDHAIAFVVQPEVQGALTIIGLVVAVIGLVVAVIFYRRDRRGKETMQRQLDRIEANVTAQAQKAEVKPPEDAVERAMAAVRQLLLSDDPDKVEVKEALEAGDLARADPGDGK